MSYQSKSTDSFNTRLRFYLFEKVLLSKGAEFQPSLEGFLEFDLRSKEALIKKYTADYYHKEREDEVDGVKVDDVYRYLQAANTAIQPLKEAWRKRYFEEVYKEQFTERSYENLINAEACAYCELPIEILRQMMKDGKIQKKNERGWNLEIDRKEPNQEYTDNNCVAACYWCNNAKTDEFNAEEFKLIEEAIGVTLKARLPKNE